MYVERIPNRNSKPTWLVRESNWIGGKSQQTTVANITRLPAEAREGIRELLKGGFVVHDFLEAFEQTYTITRRLPHGHVAAALGILRKLSLARLIDRSSSRVRNIALIVARILKPRSKLATAAAIRDDSVA